MVGTDPPMNRTWQTNTAGKLAQVEFPYQRMHREPIHIGPPDMGVTDRSVYRASFVERSEPPVQAHIGARYTLGTKNELGTHVHYHQVDIKDLKAGRVHLGSDDSRNWQSEFSQHFQKPDQTHSTKGSSAVRCGIAPRMPYSEVERFFGSLDSTGTMPGKDGKSEGTSENRHAYVDPGPAKKIDPIITLGFTNDIGSQVKYQPTAAILKDLTHFTLGNVPPAYVTTAQDAAKPPPPHTERDSRPPAGQLAPVGPSEVEQGFRQQFNSRHYNIINGGPRLHGDRNADAWLHAKNSAAHDNPVGRKQHPVVDPAFRGVSGLRQSFDIITGVDRPKHMW